MDAQLIDTILDRLSGGETLRQILLTPGYPTRQSFLRLVDPASNPLLADRYARARRDGLDVQAEQLIEVAQDDKRDPNARRVEIDARKWLLSKMRPDKYGDRVITAGDAGAPVEHRLTVVYEDKPAKMLDKGGEPR